MSLVRVREHVNPLSRKYQTVVAPPDWSEIYANPTQPLHLDIGCARGKFLLQLAPLEPTWNFLGLEIREPLVEQANQERQDLNLTNLHFLSCNANTSLAPLLNSFPPGVLQRVTIQFPDPWFKRRHQKRRVVQPELVNEIAKHLVPEGMLFVQSDVEEVAQEMRDRFDENPNFQRQTPDWHSENPLPIRTEREQWTLENGEPVYRAIFIKTQMLID